MDETEYWLLYESTFEEVDRIANGEEQEDEGEEVDTSEGIPQ
jgi:hypothetical protein